MFITKACKFLFDNDFFIIKKGEMILAKSMIKEHYDRSVLNSLSRYIFDIGFTQDPVERFLMDIEKQGFKFIARNLHDKEKNKILQDDYMYKEIYRRGTGAKQLSEFYN